MSSHGRPSGSEKNFRFESAASRVGSVESAAQLGRNSPLRWVIGPVAPPMASSVSENRNNVPWVVGIDWPPSWPITRHPFPLGAGAYPMYRVERISNTQITRFVV